MKKTASLLLAITLFSSLFYNAVEYYMMVAYQKEKSWIDSMQNLPESHYKVIKLNATLYSFIEDSDIEQVNENVVINNKVYHIFKKSIKDNVLNLYYLGDENQNAIDVCLKKLVAENKTDENTNPLKKLIKDFSNDYLVNSHELIIIKRFVELTPKFNAKNQNTLQGFFVLNYPPPKLV